MKRELCSEASKVIIVQIRFANLIWEGEKRDRVMRNANERCGHGGKRRLKIDEAQRATVTASADMCTSDCDSSVSDGPKFGRKQSTNQSIRKRNITAGSTYLGNITQKKKKRPAIA